MQREVGDAGTPHRLILAESTTDYDDFRDTGSGVEFPFLNQMNPANPRTELAPSAILRHTKVDDTTVVNASKFAKPTASSR